MSSIDKKVLTILIPIILVVLITLIAYRLPLENYLSEYPLLRTLKWYVPWRVAVVNFVLWLLSLVLYLCEVREVSIMLLVSGIIFVVAHYYMIFTILKSGYRIIIGPLVFYTNYHESILDIHLDMGQVISIVTAIVFLYEHKLKRST